MTKGGDVRKHFDVIVKSCDNLYSMISFIWKNSSTHDYESN